MRLLRADPAADKGWYTGPWDSGLSISVGYANRGIDQPHLHRQVTEIYLVARGTAVMRVGKETVLLEPGDLIVIESGEAHTFLSSSPDYFHFVIHTPGLTGRQAREDKVEVELGGDPVSPVRAPADTSP